jgi:NAD(P) transhydrogenase subunit beta
MSDFIQAGYIVAAILFILGLKGLARPRTAVRGNLLGALGMLTAVLVTLTDQSIVSYWVLVAGLIVGAVIGSVLAVKVQMTQMPELVALFNGLGGSASALVVVSSYIEQTDLGVQDDTFILAAAVSAMIGSTTFTGSIVAFAKLRESVGTWRSGAATYINVGLLLIALGFVAALVVQPLSSHWLIAIIAISAVAGVALVYPIGGGDMPVVIAFLNSMSGVAAAATGFALDNSLLIIAGSLVGASGLVLTQVMCAAMNRSLVNVLFGSISGGAPTDPDDVYEGRIRSTSADDVALILDTAERVVVVPGYGLALAQAQHAVRDLARALEQRGTSVTFAIHPVAGRMPGHMNVLLAEAEIEYEDLLDMTEANPTFGQTDVVIVVGANDVVNPLAREAGSAIAGMPILDVDRARTVVVIKRSLSPGFAGIPNPLFALDNSLMLFGDAKQAVTDITTALSES